MRTTEAARYARWSVAVATMLAVTVAGVYVERAWKDRQSQKAVPPPVPAAVQQRSAEFTFSSVAGNNTRFIVRASHATEFKEGGRTLLEDVWITAFGASGKRSDQLQSRVCEYFAQPGTVTCPEQVFIDLQGNSSEFEDPSHVNALDTASSAHIVTTHLTFNRQTGVASTQDPVEFRFARGEGRAVGLTYDSGRGELRLLHQVTIVLDSADKVSPSAVQASTRDAMSVSGGELFYPRGDRKLYLNGGAALRQGGKELRAGQIILELAEDMTAERFVAHNHPTLRDANGVADVSLSADDLTAPLQKGGRVSEIIAMGNVVLNSVRAESSDHLTAAASTLELIPESQQPRHFTATGNVDLTSRAQDGSTRHLRSPQLDVFFVPVGEADSRVDRATASSANVDWQEASPGPARQGAQSMRLKGRQLDGSFDEAGVLRKLQATGDVEVQRQMEGEPALISSSRDLLASMRPDGRWSTVDQTGGVKLRNASGNGWGDRAHFDRESDTVTMTGSVVLTDASSQTRAQTATYRQSSGELRAQGNVSTTEFAKPSPGDTPDANQPSHISSTRMITTSADGHAVYAGKARLWQGDSLIQADTIDLDRTNRKLVATGNVSAILPQVQQPRATDGPLSPVFWKAWGGRLTYEEAQQRARLEQGARVLSADGSMQADQMDLFFTAKSHAPSLTGLGSSLQGQEVQRAQGVGAVRVESAGRIGTAERGDYWAPESKFILSGGHPKLIDNFGNLTAGRQLTFFFSDDRIVVDSEEGSRTLTLHRVEK